MRHPRIRHIAAVSAAVLAFMTFAASSRAASSLKDQVNPATTTPAQTGTPEGRAAAVAEPAIAYLEMYWNAYVYMSSPDYDLGVTNVQFATRCSGFFVNPNGYVATAGHCIDDGVNGAKDIAIRHAVLQLQDQYGLTGEEASSFYADGKGYWRVEGTLAGSNPDRAVYVQHGIALGGKQTGEAWQARVIEVRDVMNGDVALLKVETTDMPIVTLAKDATIDIGTPVLSIGYPGATDEVTDATYEPSFKDGKINQKTTTGNGALPVYQTSAALSGGMSGGPTVDANGDVVGVNSFTISGETQAFDYIMPSSLVQELLSRNGVDNTVPETDVLYREAVDAYYGGDYRTAVTKFDAVLQQVPSHSQAQELRKQAAEKAKTQPVPTTAAPTTAAPTTAAPAATSGGGSNTTLIVVIVAAAVVVLGGGLFLFLRMRRNRGRGGPAPAVTPWVPPAPTTVMEPHPEKLDVAPTTPPLAPRPAESIPDVVQFCSHCGAHAEGDSAFCAHCGASLQPHTAPREGQS